MKSEISQILREQALSKNLPVLILSNKHEAENALTIDDLTQGLDVRSIKQNTQIVEISAKTGDGIIDSIKWLRSSIKSK
ncbi:hypothetical protein TRFO_01913 [Tritrichomonas foetus]|uniref:Uncharacterized protein n=1 Tax=Tritrichomonas foetus TaxID=1144522 RepID=A0A1J4JI36_9EUKA|nr:hypothetical protein TRFO_01913 [Tritrichomonas foetus]|eukprot:OHS98834.1 hypothetical protein TRFO_01913 [Tritrichomonas foetus]